MSVVSIRYENGDRSAVVCRRPDGDGWEVHLLRWHADTKRNTRTRRRERRMTKAQALARIWVAKGRP